MKNKLFTLQAILFMALIVSCQTNPSDPVSCNNRGIAHYSRGQFDLAIADFSKALEINPKFAEASNNRGIAYYSKGRFDLAIADFNKALEINPEYAEAYYNRGDLLWQKSI